MTATTPTAAEVAKRLASARDMIQRMIDMYEEDKAKYAALADADPRSWTAATGEAHARGVLGGLQESLTILHTAFDDPERDWMYRR